MIKNINISYLDGDFPEPGNDYLSLEGCFRKAGSHLKSLDSSKKVMGDK